MEDFLWFLLVFERERKQKLEVRLTGEWEKGGTGTLYSPLIRHGSFPTKWPSLGIAPWCPLRRDLTEVQTECSEFLSDLKLRSEVSGKHIFTTRSCEGEQPFWRTHMAAQEAMVGCIWKGHQAVKDLGPLLGSAVNPKWGWGRKKRRQSNQRWRR